MFSLTKFTIAEIEETSNLTNTETLTHNSAEYWSKLMEPLDATFGETFSSNSSELEDLLLFAPRALGVGLQASTSPILAAINPYGCWCNFENMPSQYGGQPIDDIDAACKVLQEGYRCLQLDHDQNCQVTAETYQAPPRYMGIRNEDQLLSKLKSHCSRVHSGTENSCGYRLCAIEAFFINTLFMHMMSGKRVNMKYSHRLGFNPEENCVRKSSGTYDVNQFGRNDFDSSDYGSGEFEVLELDGEHRTPKSGGKKNNSFRNFKPEGRPLKPKAVDTCCGEYPKRSPFNTGEKKCCHEKHIFNPMMHDCCDDGSLGFVGSC
jgi:hypothetical protein